MATWYPGRNHEGNIITASHMQELADKWGRRSRNIVAGEEFRAVFGFGLTGDSSAAHGWATERGGEYLAVGVGGLVTGNGAEGGIIDDPIKGREEAENDTAQQRYCPIRRASGSPGSGLLSADDDGSGHLHAGIRRPHSHKALSGTRYAVFRKCSQTETDGPV